MGSIERERTVFDEESAVPFDVDDDVLVEIFESHQFQEWLKNEHSWQLRIWGTPGSGKTTFSALTVQRLKQWYAGQNVYVASIFFTPGPESDSGETRASILKSIFGQLAGDSSTLTSSRHLVLSDSKQYGNKGKEIDEVVALREAIIGQVARLDHAFLIVDDIDVCRSPLYEQLEDDLRALCDPKLSILVTSRIPFSYNTNYASCNGCSRYVPIFWRCKACDEKSSDSEIKVVDICQSCKDDGMHCVNCETQADLFETYTYITYTLNQLNTFEQFVARQLESIHGDLGLDSTIEDKPPSSALGRALNRTRPRAAKALHRKIVAEADSSITIAKLRLDQYSDAQKTEDVEVVKDRLPDNVLELFRAAIARVYDQPATECKLGLYAIIGAGIGDWFPGRPFKELEGFLTKIGLLEANPEDQWFNLSRTLRATCGLLKADFADKACVALYHPFLTQYIADDYDDALCQLADTMADQLGPYFKEQEEQDQNQTDTA